MYCVIKCVICVDYIFNIFIVIKCIFTFCICNKTIIICGGTALYSRAFLYNYNFAKENTNSTKFRINYEEQAKKDGKGAVSLDGRLIDIASIRQAEVLVQKAKLIGGK